jgi:hypothetical protein
MFIPREARFDPRRVQPAGPATSDDDELAFRRLVRVGAAHTPHPDQLVPLRSRNRAGRKPAPEIGPMVAHIVFNLSAARERHTAGEEVQRWPCRLKERSRESSQKHRTHDRRLSWVQPFHKVGRAPAFHPKLPGCIRPFADIGTDLGADSLLQAATLHTRGGG